ncbi:nuclease PIN [Rothia sp. CCM 9419]|uniref:nuclease PIN n=1 Tax=Rothia sp. CCM 9419 TaxID=3402662 RepID=UPI003AE40296
MHNTARPQHNIQTVSSAQTRGGYAAVSIQDYTRISHERSEFLNFLLSPNPHGIPNQEYGILQAA